MIDIRVCYPAGAELALRCSTDWSRSIEPIGLSADGTERRFRLEGVPEGGHLYFKPVRRTDGVDVWSVGSNYLAAAGLPQRIYPHFDGGYAGRITDKLTVAGGRHVRVFLPPGYDENVLKRYPVLYVLDGANVFFPDEAFSGQPWAVDRAVECLDAMNLVDKVVVVALYSHPDRREEEYTAPGYHAFGEELAKRVVPEVRERWRGLRGAANTAVMGSSLGGVAALHLAWAAPEVFGMAACISSTFGYRDDLLHRVWSEPPSSVRVYLDSGWPGDNHAETLEVYDALVARGLAPGRDVLFLGFPGALHHEKAWSQRVHLPIQFFFGRAFRRHVDVGDGTPG